MKLGSLEPVPPLGAFVYAASTGVRLILPKGREERMTGLCISAGFVEKSELGWAVSGIQIGEDPATASPEPCA